MTDIRIIPTPESWYDPPEDEPTDDEREALYRRKQEDAYEAYAERSERWNWND